MSTAPTIAEIREFISRLALLDGHVEEPDDSSASERNSAAGMMVGAVSADANRLELISALESVKGALAAAQARIAVAFDASERATQRAAGVPAAKLGVGIAEQVALARRESPTRGSRHLGVAKALVHEMPHTMAALTSGELSEWRATLVVQATAVLDADDRRQADARLAGRLGKLSDKQVRAAAMAIAYELDPRSVVNRAAYAVTQRRGVDPASTRHRGLPHRLASCRSGGRGLRGPERRSRCCPRGRGSALARPGQGRHFGRESHWPSHGLGRPGRDRPRDVRCLAASGRPHAGVHSWVRPRARGFRPCARDRRWRGTMRRQPVGKSGGSAHEREWRT